jgi:hypothetical protein
MAQPQDMVCVTIWHFGLWKLDSGKIHQVLKSIGKEGVSEIRATYGGFFVGISLFVIATQNSQAFVLLGCGWFCAAVVRLVTLFFGFATPKNIGGVIFEIVIGSLCISPLFI